MADIAAIKAELLNGLRTYLNSATTAERSAFVMAKVRQIRAASTPSSQTGKTERKTE